MASFYFCDPCGEKRVKDVKDELVRILTQKQFDSLSCTICCSAIAMKNEFAEIQTDSFFNVSINKDVGKLSTVQAHHDNDIKTEPRTEEVDDVDKDESNIADDDQDDDYYPNEGADESDNSGVICPDAGRKNPGRKKKNLKNKSSGLLKQHKKPKRPQVQVKICDLAADVQNMIQEDTDETSVFSCKLCNESYNRSTKGVSEFVAHINSHNPEQDPISIPYQCPSCQDVFKMRSSWKKHQRVHVEKFECSHEGCSRQFRKKETLENHIKRKHSGLKRKIGPVKAEQAVCQICGAVLKYGAQSLKKHLFRHQGIKAFKCNICNKSFIDKVNLFRHQQRHEPVKNTICEVCGKKFVDIAELKTHLITHTDERTFQCEFCPYRAKRSGNLRAHIRNIHTESDPNKCTCSYCGLNFLSATACKRHEKKHLGGVQITEAILKPYQCPDCGYRATKPCQIRIHQRSHTGEKPFKCTYCDKPFTQKSQSKRHMIICKKGNPLIR